jgi:hypothetical protein
LVLIQTAAVVLIRDPVKTYSLGIYSSLSSIFLLTVLLFQDGLIAQAMEAGGRFGTREQVGLRVAQLVVVALAAFSSITLPRRPEVFFDGKPVDGMYTVSAFGRYSFSWVGHLLTLSRKKNRLELEDLPKMDHYTRSKDLSQAWGKTTHTRKLWIEVFLAHKWAFIIQWLLTLIQAFGNFAPQFVTFHILKLLEKREPGKSVGAEGWIWVAALTWSLICGVMAVLDILVRNCNSHSITTVCSNLPESNATKGRERCFEISKETD